MKKSLLFAYGILIATFLCMTAMSASQGSGDKAQPAGDRETDPGKPSQYDAQLAEKLGADAYGMRSYVMAFLKAGPNREQDDETAEKLQRAHLDNIQKLAGEGKIALAGPFLDDGELRGIYIFNVTSVEEARALTATDPAIKAGRLEMELHPWYGSAAVQMVNQWHGRIAQKNH